MLRRAYLDWLAVLFEQYLEKKQSRTGPYEICTLREAPNSVGFTDPLETCNVLKLPAAGAAVL